MRSAKNTSRQRSAKANRNVLSAIVKQPSHPPPIHPQITHHQRLRFVCATAGTQSVTAAMLMDCMLFAVTAVAGYDVFDAVKIKRIEMWALPSANNAPTTVALDFPGAGSAGSGTAGDARVFSDTSMGIEPAHISVVPSSKTVSGLWQGSGTFVMFRILTCPVGAVVDVEVTYRSVNAAPVPAAQALTGATVGQFYYRGLDGAPIASTKWTPVADATI